VDDFGRPVSMGREDLRREGLEFVDLLMPGLSEFERAAMAREYAAKLSGEARARRLTKEAK
jgi:hypothetical protein